MINPAGTARALDKDSGSVNAKPQKRFRKLRILAIILGVLLVTSYLAMAYVDRQGSQFFETGKSIVGSLHEIALAAQAGDVSKMQARFAADYSGSLLGLNTTKEVSQKDGIHRL